MHRVVVALYGRVKTVRFYCSRRYRRGIWLDEDGEDFLCCGEAVSTVPTDIERISEGARGRAQPGRAERRRILKEQDGRCAYCDKVFRASYLWRGRLHPVLLVWDHRIPYAYDQNNHASNFVAACYRCNAWKADHLFETIEEVRAYVARKWEAEAQRTRGPSVPEVPGTLSNTADVADVLLNDVPR